jgi:ubiquinone/menaquinone biosynthesis C-methylase UbiE
MDASAHPRFAEAPPIADADWSTAPLPPAWPDGAGQRGTRWLRMWRGLVGGPNVVTLPDGLPGKSWLPSYLLREFHRMPNGYYSEMQSRGYDRGFEAAMLGRMKDARDRITQRLRHARRALDLGCGTGRLAASLLAAGVQDVVGLDPCPYLLRLAAQRTPGARFVQGLAEETGFEAGRFDAIGACFVFHELPSHVADRALADAHRTLAPGGLLAITEPSPEQLRETSPWALFRRGGWSALWFRVVALLAREPYIDEWHAKEPGPWLERAGFELLEDETTVPFRHLLARKRGT